MGTLSVLTVPIQLVTHTVSINCTCNLLIRSQTHCPVQHRTSDISCSRSACHTSLSKSLPHKTLLILATLVPFKGPKKSRFSGPPPLKCPSLWIVPPQNHFVPHHINNRYINSYYVMHTVFLLKTYLTESVLSV